MKIYPYFDETINSSDLSSVTGTKPYSLVVLGQEFNVKTWADVLMYTLKVVSDLAPDKLENNRNGLSIARWKKTQKFLEDLKSCAMNIIMNQI